MGSYCIYHFTSFHDFIDIICAVFISLLAICSIPFILWYMILVTFLAILYILISQANIMATEYQVNRDDVQHQYPKQICIRKRRMIFKVCKFHYCFDLTSEYSYFLDKPVTIIVNKLHISFIDMW